jgi:glutathione synthase/RimK-type ligase-like ATP-grasp enzyme
MTVALATSRDHPDLPDDDRLLLRALAERGVDVQPLVWDGSDLGEAADIVVLRSTWNYHHDVLGFIAWVVAQMRGGARVINDPLLVEWNAHKQYLTALAQSSGIPIVPTALHYKAEQFADWQRDEPWRDIVIKPAVSASGFMTERFTHDSAAARAHVEAILALGRAAMVQPFVEDVMVEGERSYVMIDGNFTHCVWRPPFGRGSIEAEASARCMDPRPDEMELVHRTLRALPSAPVYARIDIVRYNGAPVLSEAELIEPSLYFALCPRAADALADAIIACGAAQR